MEGPIYTQVYTYAEESEPDAFKVFFPDASGETPGTTSYLRPCTFAEALTPRPVTYVSGEMGEQPRTIYVAIEHELGFPYAAWDCEEVLDQPTLKQRIGYESQPRRFCQAAIVATPKMALIG